MLFYSPPSLLSLSFLSFLLPLILIKTTTEPLLFHNLYSSRIPLYMLFAAVAAAAAALLLEVGGGGTTGFHILRSGSYSSSTSTISTFSIGL
mmetsp:Transcript_2823/g.4444  ORF Transcript_2823/g.4444 Transcript_2823/m.4444 type:complete len:92 (-) Transcript_2823:494-769(-)